MLDRWRLNGLLMLSGTSSPCIGDMPSGGVPAFADVELTDCGVPAPGDSSVLRWGDLRVDDGSPIGSAECCRLSCAGVSGARKSVCGACETYLDLLYTLSELALTPRILG